MNLFSVLKEIPVKYIAVGLIAIILIVLFSYLLLTNKLTKYKELIPNVNKIETSNPDDYDRILNHQLQKKP